jgi:hypothetical protein
VLTSFEQACNGCLLEEFIDTSGYLFPAMMDGAGVCISAACATDEAAASSGWLERGDDARDGESFGGYGETKSPFGSAFGAEYSRPREEVKRFRQVVARTSHDAGDVVHADRGVPVRLRDAEDSVKCLLGGAGQPHQRARRK